MNTENSQKIQITVADPSALGLFGLAMVCFVASSQKLGITTGVSFVVPWAIFLGSIAQMIASVFDLKRNNVFGATVFGAYGLFWITMAACWLIKAGAFGPELANTADGKQLGFAFIGYLFFSLFGTVAAMETNKIIFTIMVLIDVLFFTLALDSLQLGGHWAFPIASYAEMAIALVGFYGAGATFLNQWFGKPTLSLGKPFGVFKYEKGCSL